MRFNYRTQYREYRQYLDQLRQRVNSPVAQVSLAIVGTLLLTALLIMIAIRPTVTTITGLVKDISDEERVVLVLDRKIQSLQIAQRRIEQLKPKLSIVHTAIPSIPDLEGIARRLEVLARDHGVVLLEFTQEDLFVYPVAVPTISIEKPMKIHAIPVRIALGGSEDSIRTYMDDLERLDRIGSIDSVRLSAIPPKARMERPFPVYGDIHVNFYTTHPVGELEQSNQRPSSPERGEDMLR